MTRHAMSRREALKCLGGTAAALALGTIPNAQAAAPAAASAGQRRLRVLLFNGSPHPRGCTFTALSEIAAALAAEEVETEIFQLGNRPIAGCIGCGACRDSGHCFRQDAVNEIIDRIDEFDGFVFGSPVHYAAASGAATSFFDRLFYAAGRKFAGKPGACAVSCRRAGSTAALEQLNKYMIISNMPLVPSQYWPMVHGNRPEEVRQDLEGLQIMRQLGFNMAWLLKCLEAGRNAGIRRRVETPRIATNFIR